MDVLTRRIKLVFKIKNIHFKGLERNVRDMGTKNRKLFDVFNRVLRFQMKVYHFGMFK
jgi:hypothetical protein